MASRFGLAALASAAFGTGCYGFDPKVCQTRCDVAAGEDAVCPNGLSCYAGGYCASSPGEAEACVASSTPDAALVDGPQSTPDAADVNIPGERFAASHANACVIRSDKSLWCWGDNKGGQILPGAPSFAVPVPTAIAPDDGLQWTSVSIGLDFICGLAHDGADPDQIFCWGSDNHHVLGPGLGDFRAVPLPAGAEPRAIAVGDRHACAIGDGPAGTQAYCWGDNTSMQLAIPLDTTNRAMPGPIAGTEGATAVHGGGAFACVEVDDQLRCWGEADDFEAADAGSVDCGSGIAGCQPEAAARFADPVGEIGLGLDYGCELGVDGALRCWGSNGYGQLGDGGFVSRTTLGELGDLAGGVLHTWRTFDLSSFLGCAVASEDGTVWCWGSSNAAHGERGDGTFSLRAPTPSQVTTLSGAATDVAVGSDFACARLAGVPEPNDVVCWGDNAVGQLGRGDSARVDTPTVVPVPEAAGVGAFWTDVVAGGDFTCASTNNGKVWCWGDNRDGVVRPTMPGEAPIYDPSPVAIADGVGSLSAGRAHVCGIQDTDVLCWGGNASLQLGSDVVSDRSKRNSFPQASLTGLTTGATRTCVRKEVAAVGSWECWGDGTARAVDNEVTATTSVLVLADGFRCKKDPGGISCQGINTHGQLGVGDTNNYIGFQSVDNYTSPVNEIAEGVSSHRCASVGTEVGCWGDSSFREVTPDAGGDVLSPAMHDFGLNVNRVVVGEDHSCVQLAGAAGQVTCWGNNDWGQTGPSPDGGYRAVPGSFSSNISAGARHTCAFSDLGELKCWGSNTRGAIGIGRNDRNRAAPIAAPPD